MTSTDQKPATPQTLKPEEIPYTSPQLMSRYITDTGKILPRKYTGMSAKQQRKVTSKIKSARNLLTML
jgi:small subunit ribosomal protein S18